MIFQDSCFGHPAAAGRLIRRNDKSRLFFDFLDNPTHLLEKLCFDEFEMPIEAELLYQLRSKIKFW
ncbi:MAG: hypothetical protein ACE5HO_15715, partial [bacterium]